MLLSTSHHSRWRRRRRCRWQPHSLSGATATETHGRRCRRGWGCPAALPLSAHSPPGAGASSCAMLGCQLLRYLILCAAAAHADIAKDRSMSCSGYDRLCCCLRSHRSSVAVVAAAAAATAKDRIPHCQCHCSCRQSARCQTHAAVAAAAVVTRAAPADAVLSDGIVSQSWRSGCLLPQKMHL